MAERKKLTPKQEKIVARRGMFVVKACPGSGKTFAVAARFAYLLRDWPHGHRGIAVMSFTNVAWQEIQQLLAVDFGVRTPIAFPHYLGTIDGFLNQYIFLPFGHLVMPCNRRPGLIGPPLNSWEPIGAPYVWGNGECYKRGCKLNHFSYDLDRNLINVLKSRSRIFQNCPTNHDRCSILKDQVVKAGWATQRDAIYFAVRVLEEYPSVAKATVARFPLLMVDEVQDTSAIEMRLVELLIGNGLREVMLIGDPEQAIFEWRDAQPELMEAKYSEWQGNSLILDENWRSSQKICNFFHKMSGLARVPEAVNPQVAHFGVDPEIWAYSDGGLGDLALKFIHLCEANEIALQRDTVAVLARSSELVKDILGNRQSGQVGEPWRDTNSQITRALCEARCRFDHGEYEKAMKVLAKAVCAKQTQREYCSEDDLELFVDEYGRVQWRQDLYQLLTLLPNTDRPLGEWIEQANERIKEKWLGKLGELAIKGGKNHAAYAQMNIAAMFMVSDMSRCSLPHRVGTIHSAKGETIDAVLVALKEKAADSRRYAAMLDNGEGILTNEELRIVYVGITRARRILVLGVPEKSRDAWERKFIGS
jgi:DNA helicase-2/ATP-dependent DNA helicase PcrA